MPVLVELMQLAAAAASSSAVWSPVHAWLAQHHHPPPAIVRHSPSDSSGSSKHDNAGVDAVVAERFNAICGGWYCSSWQWQRPCLGKKMK
jgi:hypothetical protein